MDEWEKIIDTLDDNVEKEFVDEWYCNECDYGPMNEGDDECGRCSEPHPTLKKKDTTNEDGWGDENVEAELEEIY